MIIDFDGSVADLQAKHDGMAADGDTLRFPFGGGSYRWSTNPFISKGVTLSGSSVISGDHTTTMVATDNTIIYDDKPLDGDGNAVLIFVVVPAGKKARITGLTLRQGTRTQQPNVGGIYMPSDSTSMRIDHCHFDDLKTTPITVRGGTRGVIDHNIFEATLNNEEAVLFTNGKDTYGDTTWAEDPGYGTSDFMFSEDNTYHWKGDPGIGTAMAFDCFSGGKFVSRYDTWINCKPNTHGTETSGRNRSSRAIEVYNCTLSWTAGYGPSGGQIRGGGALIHHNTYTNFGGGYGLRVYREWDSYLFGRADGASQWDVNADTDGTTPVAAGAAGHLFYSGTHTGSNGVAVLTDSGASFPSLTGFVIRNMGSDGATFKFNTYVGSNNGTTITSGKTESDNSVPYTWNTGDHYEVRKVLIALDQPGRGKGDVLGTTNPNQALEPIYSWNNTNNGSPLNIFSYGEPTIQEGRDFYNETAMPGYTPFTYPHTLISGLVGDTTPPTVAITSPSGTVSGVITLSATATDDVAMAGVQFRRDGVNNIGVEVIGAGPTYTRTLDTSTISNGTHTFTATARDTSNNTTVSAVVTLTVSNADVTPPVVTVTPITSPVSGTITVAATATDNVAVAGVTFKHDGVTIGSEDTSAPYSVSLDTTALTDGVHSITATARDTSGNTTVSTAVNITVANGSSTTPVDVTGKKHKKVVIPRRRR